MAKMVDNSVLDAALNVIRGSTRMTVCSAQPANYAGIAAVLLAPVTMAPADFVIANGDTSGRKVTMGAKSTVPVTASGSATHVCLDNGATLLYATTCASVAVTNGGQVNIPTWKVEIASPS